MSGVQMISAAPVNGHELFNDEISIGEFNRRASECKSEEEAQKLVLDTLASMGYAGALAVLWSRFPIFKREK